MKRLDARMVAIALWAGLAVACSPRADTSPPAKDKPTSPKAAPANTPTVAQVAPSAAAPPASRPVSRPEPKPAVRPTVKVTSRPAAVLAFAGDAFPPTLSDTPEHEDPWLQADCLRCHATGVQSGPVVRHEGMPPILLAARCRSCHVLIPGSSPRKITEPAVDADGDFAENAFPPMIPDSGSHVDTWLRDDCLLCHDSGIKGAPIVEHAGIPKLLLDVKCRTCHVQFRHAFSVGK